MMRTVVLPALCGVALGAQTKPARHFMAFTQQNCDPSAYKGPASYDDLCDAISADCKKAADALKGKHDSNLSELEEECKRQKRILAGKEDDHAEEEADVRAQMAIVDEEHMDVKKARETVKEYASCRPELVAAKDELAKQEAIPNDTPSDIDAECEAQKLVMEKEACVLKLKAAERVLRTQKGQHAAEHSDLKGEEGEEASAAAELPPQEENVRIACQAFDDAKSKGPPQVPACGNGRKDALVAQADAHVKSLLAEYLRQKKILENKQGVHSDEKADVDAQEKIVGQEKQDVKEAQVAVDENAHCPPELKEAKEELAKQEGIPNDTSEDIDAECAARKRVMEAEQCVEVLRRAQVILGGQKDEHSGEKSDLHAENHQENKAAAALPPQEKIVCDLKAALDAARAARDTLPCGKDEKPAPASVPEPSKEPEKKSGAARASAMVALVAVVLGSMVA